MSWSTWVDSKILAPLKGYLSHRNPWMYGIFTLTFTLNFRHSWRVFPVPWIRHGCSCVFLFICTAGVFKHPRIAVDWTVDPSSQEAHFIVLDSLAEWVEKVKIPPTKWWFNSTPWKMTGWNLLINHLERKMIWTKPPWLCSTLIFQGVIHYGTICKKHQLNKQTKWINLHA